MLGEATSDLIMYEEDCAFPPAIVFFLASIIPADSVAASRESHSSEIRTPLQNTQCRMLLCFLVGPKGAQGGVVSFERSVRRSTGGVLKKMSS